MKGEVTSAPKAEALLNGELWLARRIALHGVKVFEGDTDTAKRRERFRQAIKHHGLESVVCGGRGGKPATYAQAFERLYGEKL
jgi:hypothetical protein